MTVLLASEGNHLIKSILFDELNRSLEEQTAHLGSCAHCLVDLLRKNRSQDNTDLVYPYLDTLVTGYPQETEIRYAKILCVAINFIGFYRLKYFKILVPECT